MDALPRGCVPNIRCKCNYIKNLEVKVNNFATRITVHICTISLTFLHVFNGIFFCGWFSSLGAGLYVLVYRRPAPKKEENFSLVEQKEVKSFYDNVIQF